MVGVIAFHDWLSLGHSSRLWPPGEEMRFWGCEKNSSLYLKYLLLQRNTGTNCDQRAEPWISLSLDCICRFMEVPVLTPTISISVNHRRNSAARIGQWWAMGRREEMAIDTNMSLLNLILWGQACSPLGAAMCLPPPLHVTLIKARGCYCHGCQYS